MWRLYIDAAARWVPCARVCFDRFHVAKQLRDTVRKQVHRRRRVEGDRTLVGTKCLLLESPGSMLPECVAACEAKGRVHALGLSAGAERGGVTAVGLCERRLGKESVAFPVGAGIAEQA